VLNSGSYFNKPPHFPQCGHRIEGICDRIAEVTPGAADRPEEQIHRAVRTLAMFSGIGHTCDDVADKRYLFRAIGNYVIAHRKESKDLIVVRFLHGARDFRRLFNRKQ